LYLAGPGVYYGDIDVSGNAGADTVTTNCKLIAYQRDEGEKQSTPLSIVLTEFHLLVLFPDRLKAMCVLNEQVIFDDAMTDVSGIFCTNGVMTFVETLMTAVKAELMSLHCRMHSNIEKVQVASYNI
jgi:hypothetical protein